MNSNIAVCTRTISVVIPEAVIIEEQMRSLGYVGKGLHELATAADGDLHVDVIRAVRKIATIRNRAAHKAGFSLDSDGEESFLNSARFVKEALERQRRLQSRKDSRTPTQAKEEAIANWAIAAITVAGLVAWWLLHH